MRNKDPANRPVHAYAHARSIIISLIKSTIYEKVIF
jgi:hypothetical protein